MSLRLEVDDEVGQAALDHAGDPGNRVLGDGVDERIGPAEAVGGGYDIDHREERIGGVRRLALENVEPSSGDPLFPKRSDQRLLVDDRAAGDVD